MAEQAGSTGNGGTGGGARERSGSAVPAPKIRSTPPPAPPKVVYQARPNFRSDRKPAAAAPKRVRGGVKLTPKEGAPGWVAARIHRLIELASSGEALREGLEYAKLGQARRLELEEGRAVATIQGRRDKPYRTTLELRHFTDAQRARVVEAMADQAKYAAKLLAGELPSNIEDAFAPLGLKLLPAEPGDVAWSCSCTDKPEDGSWCKHTVCVAGLLAEKLGTDPLAVFGLRGLPREELLERLREQRGQGVAPGVAVPVYSAHRPAGVVETRELEADLDRFWEMGPEAAGVDMPIGRPETSHVLLRRLGASPFPEGRFPLMGLLATCYEVISEAAVEGEPGDGAE
jgi:uncharacterized Zn finger protein